MFNNIFSKKTVEVIKIIEIEKLPYTENLPKNKLKIACDWLTLNLEVCRNQQKWFTETYIENFVGKQRELPKVQFEDTENYNQYTMAYCAYKFLKEQESTKLENVINIVKLTLKSYGSNVDLTNEINKIINITFSKDLAVCTLHCIDYKRLHELTFLKRDILNMLKDFGTIKVEYTKSDFWDTFEEPTLKVNEFVFDKK